MLGKGAQMAEALGPLAGLQIASGVSGHAVDVAGMRAQLEAALRATGSSTRSG